MNAHPAADLFPLLSGDAYERFKADIRDNGQREAVVMYRGQILDGRNRHRACTDLGIVPRTREWIDDGKGPTAYVMSTNLHRRHLDDSQRAMVAARAKPMFEAEAKARQEATRAKPGERADQRESARADLPGRSEPSRAREQAAAAVNVSPRLVESAAHVLRHGAPELVRAVERGEVKVSAAAEVARLPKEEQRAAVTEGPAKVREVAREVREERREAPRPQTVAPVVEILDADETPSAAPIEVSGGSLLWAEAEKIRERCIGLARHWPFDAGKFADHIAETAQMVRRCAK